MSAQEAKKSSGIKGTVLTALISLSIGAGGFWYFQEKGSANASESSEAISAQEQSTPVAISAEPVFIEFEPFTVTFNSPTTSRVLYLSLTLRVQDEASLERINQYMPVARSSVLTILGELDPNILNERETKDHIRDSVIEVLSKPFAAHMHGQIINDVLFTAFVVQ